MFMITKSGSFFYCTNINIKNYTGNLFGHDIQLENFERSIGQSKNLVMIICS